MVLVLVIVARLALAVARRALTSRHSGILFAGFFVGLGAGGGLLWIALVPKSDRMEFLHIPIVAGGLIVFGIAWWVRHLRKRQSR